MRFISCFINYVNTIFIGQFEIPDNRRIMRSSHTVNVELFQYGHILSDSCLIHSMPGYGMLHVAVDPVKVNMYTIQVEDLVPDLSLFETDPAIDRFYSFTGGIN